MGFTHWHVASSTLMSNQLQHTHPVAPRLQRACPGSHTAVHLHLPSPSIAVHFEQLRCSVACRAGFGSGGFGGKAKSGNAGPKECPCGSGRAYKDCCLPFHKSKSLWPDQPQQLVAARYAAFAGANKDDKDNLMRSMKFLRRTSHPDNPALKGSTTAPDAGVQKQCSYEEDLATTFTAVDFCGFELLGSSVSQDGSSATIDYAVTIKRKVDSSGNKVEKPQQEVLKERASLQKDGDGRWLLLDAKAIEPANAV